MKKINITGMIAAMTIAAATMAVPAMAQSQITEAQSTITISMQKQAGSLTTKLTLTTE